MKITSFLAKAKVKFMDVITAWGLNLFHNFKIYLFVCFRDLSNTAITSLPTAGLQKLEVLRIERTPSLKYIPSIYEFQVSQ